MTVYARIAVTDKLSGDVFVGYVVDFVNYQGEWFYVMSYQNRMIPMFSDGEKITILNWL